ncbi:hypothetical protein LMG23992_04349 [Cupriavidus laharis]|uniref:Sterol desaturase family protein n=1 Tax=Cupriavidus laharis TaxID=151654 RepID=A0ABM8XL59_9BURK|nr:hypothetical protein LMG23992_04349 [Cupriavidus laharis]
MHTESLDPGLILLAFAPAFLLTIGWEAWYWSRRRDMFADAWRDRDLRYLWKPPEWRSPRARART